jgi:hypothetical protein
VLRRARRIWHVFLHGDGKPDHVYRCPVCGRPVVGKVGSTLGRGTMIGPIHFEPNEAELVARCPLHGWGPWNDPDRDRRSKA